MAVFQTPRHRADIALRADIAGMQAFFEANPAYTRLTEGREVPADAAETEFDDGPPPGFTYNGRWLLLMREQRSGALVGVIDLVKDLLAPGVWHIGLFFVGEALHGSGLAAEWHAAMQQWMQGQGARWLRLNVVAHNLRGARFWRRQGYRFVCTRTWEAPGGRINTVWCLVKPLADESVAGYLAAQAHDAQQPEPAGWARLPAG